MEQLAGVVAEDLLGGIQGIDAAAQLRRAGAVLGEHDLVADVDRR